MDVVGAKVRALAEFVREYRAEVLDQLVLNRQMANNIVLCLVEEGRLSMPEGLGLGAEQGLQLGFKAVQGLLGASEGTIAYPAGSRQADHTRETRGGGPYQSVTRMGLGDQGLGLVWTRRMDKVDRRASTIAHSVFRRWFHLKCKGHKDEREGSGGNVMQTGVC